MARPEPDWSVPADLKTIVAREGEWESTRWEPIALSVLGGTIHEGRYIPMAWQIQLEPFGGEFTDANRRIAATGAEAGAYGWSDRIVKAFTAAHPEFAAQTHDDSEMATCVVWVESEEACRALVSLVWKLIYA